MRKISNKGFSKIEFMTMFAVIAILTAIGVKIVSDSTKSYGGFKNVANNFANSVAKYKDRYPRDDNIYVLDDVIKKGFSDELKNPVNTTQSCDRYESYVEVPQPNNKIVKLLCGNYYVEGTQGNGYSVYELGEWSTGHDDDMNDNGVLFNYSVGGKEELDEYVTARTFLKKYYEKTGKLIISPYDVKNVNGQELLTKKVYRTKTLVKELK